MEFRETSPQVKTVWLGKSKRTKGVPKESLSVDFVFRQPDISMSGCAAKPELWVNSATRPPYTASYTGGTGLNIVATNAINAPAINPPMCANTATPPPSLNVSTPSDANPAANWMMNQ